MFLLLNQKDGGDLISLDVRDIKEIYTEREHSCTAVGLYSSPIRWLVSQTVREVHDLAQRAKKGEPM